LLSEKNVNERKKVREDEDEAVSNYWMTFTTKFGKSTFRGSLV